MHPDILYLRLKSYASSFVTQIVPAGPLKILSIGSLCHVVMYVCVCDRERGGEREGDGGIVKDSWYILWENSIRSKIWKQNKLVASVKLLLVSLVSQ